MRIALDLNGTLDTSAALQNMVRAGVDQFYVITSGYCVEDVVAELSDLGLDEGLFAGIVVSEDKAADCFKLGCTVLYDDDLRWSDGCKRYGVEFRLV